MNEQEQRRLLAPILVGVVGHTRLRSEDDAVLRAAVHSILKRLRRDYPSTPLLLVSSLAEGADQLCAEVALEMGHDVVAPLPFPVELYGTRFKSALARENLRRLAGHPNVKTFCPAQPDGTVADFARILADDGLRKRRYADVAIFVARHAHALVVLWDGERGANASLTAQLIDFKTLGRRPAAAASSLAAPEPGVVYFLFAPRPEWVPTATPAPGTLEILPRADGTEVSLPSLFDQTCRLTDSLNSRIANRATPTRNDLAPDGADCTPAENDLAAFRRLVADESYVCKTWVNRAYISVFFLVFLGAALLHFYGHMFDIVDGETVHSPSLLNWAIVCFAVAALFPRVTRRTENCAQDYRALAEALRVQFHWHHAGLSEWVPDHYLQRQQSELLWIREASRAWALRLQAEPGARAPDLARMGAIATAWFEGQERFYAKRHHENIAAQNLGRWIYLSCAGIAAALALILAAGDFIPGELSATHVPHHITISSLHIHLHFPYLLGIGLALLASAMALAYCEKRLFAEHARHFGAMRALFHDAITRTTSELAAGRPDSVAILLRQMGEESLDENTQWLILHRIRHFEVPATG